MKKIFLIILFIILFVGPSISQRYAEIIFPTKLAGYNWQQVGVQCNNCASFFIGVSRSDYTNEYGNYKYTIYYQTNSSDYLSTPRMTYITGIRYYYYDYINGNWFPFDNTDYWLLCKNEPFMSYSILSPEPTLRVKITIENYVIR